MIPARLGISHHLGREAKASHTAEASCSTVVWSLPTDYRRQGWYQPLKEVQSSGAAIKKVLSHVPINCLHEGDGTRECPSQKSSEPCRPVWEETIFQTALSFKRKTTHQGNNNLAPSLTFSFYFFRKLFLWKRISEKSAHLSLLHEYTRPEKPLKVETMFLKFW